MKVHLTVDTKHVLHQILMGSHGLGMHYMMTTEYLLYIMYFIGATMSVECMQELKSFQTLLVRSESLLRNAVHTNLMVSYSEFIHQICYYYYDYRNH